MTKVDLIALGFVALTAFIGWKKGLLASALSVAGIVLGAWLGSRLAPALLQGGAARRTRRLPRWRAPPSARSCSRRSERSRGRRCAHVSASHALNTFDSFGGLALGGLRRTRDRLGARRGRAAAAGAGRSSPRRAEVGAAPPAERGRLAREGAQRARAHRPVPGDHRARPRR